MTHHAQALLEPRKTPVQARSTASVSAILEATIQVLLDVGKERLTTTRVAARAGVSVGILYQYFPNKSALLQAVLRRHFSELTDAIDAVCREQRGTSLSQMATALVTAFLEAKMRDVNTSAALYSVGVRHVGIRTSNAVAEMLATASEPLTVDPQLVASMLQATLAGVSRRLLESHSPEREVEIFRRELIVLACAYLKACSLGSSQKRRSAAPGS